MSNFSDVYNTPCFREFWDNSEEFLTDWKASDFFDADDVVIQDKSVKLTFALLNAKYSNSPVRNRDPYQFTNKLFSLIFQFGPTWEKELAMQKKLRSLTDDDLLKGATSIYNHAFNPSQAPTTQTTEELEYINDQNVTKYKKGILDGYNQLDMLLKTDVTGNYIAKFQKLFKQFVSSENPEFLVDDYE